MEYKVYPPPPVLRDYIRYFWTYDTRNNEGGTICIKSFADRYPRLIFQNLEQFESFCTPEGENLPTCYLSGIDTQNTVAIIHGNWSHFGISFYPHALNAFFGIGANELINQMPDIQWICKKGIPEQLKKANSTAERIQIISKYLYEKIDHSRNKNLLINHIIQRNDIAINTNIYSLHKKYNISERHFERLFKQSVGISAKKYQRIVRFEKALELLSDARYNDLTIIAHKLDYTDQSHFIKDFKAFSGTTPYSFIKNQHVGSESSSFLYTLD